MSGGHTADREQDLLILYQHCFADRSPLKGVDHTQGVFSLGMAPGTPGSYSPAVGLPTRFHRKLKFLVGLPTFLFNCLNF